MKLQRRHLLALLGGTQLPALAQVPDMKALEKAARAEGRIHSVGMPDIWANWRATWADLRRLYGLVHVDENMNSAEEIERMAADGRQGTVDIGDVGYEYAAVARGRGISLASRTALWEQIPAWAKDADGYWALAYTGTISFLVNKRRAGVVPRTWKALFASGLRVQIGEVGSSSQGNAGVLAAAVSQGGHERDLGPALAAFALLARAGRLSVDNPKMQRISQALAGDPEVYVMWDFQALAMREKLHGKADYEVLIPEDGSITSGYTPLINRYAPHPNAALLAREYIFSDAGQMNLARGYARPIRIAHLQLPEAVRKGLLDDQQYRHVRAVEPAIWAWEAKQLGPVWQREVLGKAAR